MNSYKILVIRLSSLGDILLTTPLVRSLKKMNCRIDYLLRPAYEDAIRLNPNIDSILHYTGSSDRDLKEQIRQNKYDAVIDLQNNVRSGRLTGGLDIPVYRFRKHGLKKLLLVRLKVNLLKDAPPVPVRYASALKGSDMFGSFEFDQGGLELHIPGGTGTGLVSGGNYIGLCPGARHYTKQWPVEYYIQLGNILSGQGFTPVLFGGRSDRELCRRIAGEVSGAIDMSSDDQLFATAAGMKQCRAIVCNDSGLMHVACSVNVPVAVIFGSTVKEFGFAPYKNTNTVLEDNNLKCRPCTHIGREKCPLGHFRCMRNIAPDAVFSALTGLLK